MGLPSFNGGSTWLSLLNGNHVHEEPSAFRRWVLRGAKGFVVFPAASRFPILFPTSVIRVCVGPLTVSASDCTQLRTLTLSVTLNPVI